jgi:hypothetical protein
MRKDIKLPENPTKQDTEDFHKLDENYRNSWKKRIYKVGDKIKISDNPCSMMCGCYYKNNKFDNFIDINTIYTVKEIHYFGGGCPPVLLEIEELPQTHSYEKSVTANIFEVLK